MSLKISDLNIHYSVYHDVIIGYTSPSSICITKNLRNLRLNCISGKCAKCNIKRDYHPVFFANHQYIEPIPVYKNCFSGKYRIEIINFNILTSIEEKTK